MDWAHGHFQIVKIQSAMDVVVIVICNLSFDIHLLSLPMDQQRPLPSLLLLPDVEWRGLMVVHSALFVIDFFRSKMARF